MCSGLSSPVFSSTKSFRRKGGFSFSSFLCFLSFFLPSFSSLTYPWKASVFADFMPKFLRYRFKSRGKSWKKSELAQSCPTLCDPMHGSLPGSALHGIFQARILKWAAISLRKCGREKKRWTCTDFKESERQLRERHWSKWNKGYFRRGRVFGDVLGYVLLWFTRWIPSNDNDISFYYLGLLLGLGFFSPFIFKIFVGI